MNGVTHPDEELMRKYNPWQTKLDELLAQPILSVGDLEGWLEASSRCLAEMEDELLRVSIRFKCRTSEAKYRGEYEYCESAVKPLLQRYRISFDERLLSNQFVGDLDDSRYARLLNSKIRSVAIHTDANEPLERKEAQLVTEYYQIVSGIQISWDGGHIGRSQANANLQSPDRQVRERAWRAIHQAEARYKDQMDDIMSQLVKLRHQIALHAGFSNYVDYIFEKKQREYSPSDCSLFHEAVGEIIIPIQDEIRRRHQRDLGVEQYRPWDEGETGRDFPSFSSMYDILRGAEAMLSSVDTSVGDVLRDMLEENMLDVHPRMDKAPGGFNGGVGSSHKSFIFLNLAPNFRAALGLIHEIGHAYHHRQTSHEPLQFLRKPGLEGCELASHSMELLTLNHWSELYTDPADYTAIRTWRMRYAIRLFAHVATVDAFQHWMYRHPTHTAADRDVAYIDIRKRLSGHLADWDGLETEMVTDWHGILHIFNYPFYFIEYAIAEIGAQQILNRYEQNPAVALSDYRHALALGNQVPLQDMYAAAGVNLDFSASGLRGIAEGIASKLSV